MTRAEKFTSLFSGTPFKLDRGKTDMTFVKGTYLNESPKNSKHTSKLKRIRSKTPTARGNV